MALSEFRQWEHDLKDKAAAFDSVTESEEEIENRKMLAKYDAIHRLVKLTGDRDLMAKWAQKRKEAADPDLISLAAFNLDFDDFDEFASDAEIAVTRMDEDNRELSARTVVDHYLKDLQAKVNKGQRSAGLYGQTRTALNHFAEWFGESTSLEALNEEHVREYHSHMVGRIGQLKEVTVAHYTKLWRTFVEEIADDYTEIEAPRNLRSKRYVIRPGNTEVDVFTKKEVTTFLELASPRLELCLLLMLNCGMTQQDISDVRDSEVDWSNGRIIRHRSKEPNAPTINWILWDRTFQLLKEFGAHRTPVLQKSAGGNLVESGVKEDGRPYRRDAIVSNWRHLVEKAVRQKRLKKSWHKSLKQLRKTGASTIESGPHAEFVDVFLDHSRVARRHYLKGQIVPMFDEAVIWLGKQFCLKTLR